LNTWLLPEAAVEALAAGVVAALVDTKHQHYLSQHLQVIQLPLVEVEAHKQSTLGLAVEEVHQFLHQSHQLAVVVAVGIGHQLKAHLDLIQQQEMGDLEDLEVAEIIGEIQAIQTG
jgi:hypothetical protein